MATSAGGTYLPTFEYAIEVARQRQQAAKAEERTSARELA
jgi:hypothetical protein